MNAIQMARGKSQKKKKTSATHQLLQLWRIQCFYRAKEDERREMVSCCLRWSHVFLHFHPKVKVRAAVLSSLVCGNQVWDLQKPGKLASLARKKTVKLLESYSHTLQHQFWCVESLRSLFMSRSVYLFTKNFTSFQQETNQGCLWGFIPAF